MGSISRLLRSRVGSIMGLLPVKRGFRIPGIPGTLRVEKRGWWVADTFVTPAEGRGIQPLAKGAAERSGALRRIRSVDSARHLPETQRADKLSDCLVHAAFLSGDGSPVEVVDVLR